MKWYLVTYYTYSHPRIKDVSIDRFTESSVWINGGRRAIETDSAFYCQSVDEAKKWVENKMLEEIAKRKDQLEIAEKRLRQAEKELEEWMESPIMKGPI